MHPHGFIGERARRAEFLRRDRHRLESCSSWRLLNGVIEVCSQLGREISRYCERKGANKPLSHIAHFALLADISRGSVCF